MPSMSLWLSTALAGWRWQLKRCASASSKGCRVVIRQSARVGLLVHINCALFTVRGEPVGPCRQVTICFVQGLACLLSYSCPTVEIVECIRAHRHVLKNPPRNSSRESQVNSLGVQAALLYIPALGLLQHMVRQVSFWILYCKYTVDRLTATHSLHLSEWSGRK